MTKGNYSYPEDEFDGDPGVDTPVGVHRAPRSWWSRWWPFVAVIIVVPAPTVGAVMWASSWDGLGTGGNAPSTASTQATDDTATDPATGNDDPAVTDGTDGGAIDQQTPEETVPDAEATPDFTLPIEVLNAARVSGIAGDAASTLEAAGFTSVTTGNGDASLADVTTVFYANADQAVTAQAVANALGITPVVESAQSAGTGIVVVLRADFSG